MPTNVEDAYAISGIKPDRYFIPSSTKLRAYIAYRPAVEFATEFANYMLSEYERDLGFVITDMFESTDTIFFARDLTDIFPVALEAHITQGIYPKYTDDVVMTYDTVIYQRNIETGDLVIDPISKLPIVIHEIGETVYTADGEAVIKHHKGDAIVTKDDNGNFIYATPPSVKFTIFGLPLIAMTAMIDEDTKIIVYENLKKMNDKLYTDVLPNLIENNTVSIQLSNTIGPSELFEVGTNGVMRNLENIDISIELNVKLINNDNAETLKESITSSTSEYIEQMANNGALYASSIIAYLKSLYTDITYIEFVRFNNLSTSLQTIQSKDISGLSTKTEIVPEYITIHRTLDEKSFRKDGTVILTPDVVINIIL
jgi:hypothetical protein